jgi:N-acetylglucosaminyldiphosphoundecaprenol N-acetyl-beta-D-mannosaminyltransferase
MNPEYIECIDFLGIRVSVLTTDETIQKILKFALAGRRKIITYLNAHCVNVAFADQDYKKILNSADIVHADGMSIVWTSRLLGKPLPGKIYAPDFFNRLIEESIRHNISFYFLGGRAGIVRKAVENLRKTFPSAEIKGSHNGYLDYEEERKVINEINKLKPNILIIGMGVPKQEKWVYAHLNELNVNLCWMVGALDNLSGALKRPPKWMSDICLAWLFRLLQEPKRLWKRYLIGNPVFIYNVLKFMFIKMFQIKCIPS